MEDQEIYAAAEDSYLLEKYVGKFVKQGQDVLDMGTGSGILAGQALKCGANVIAVDINQNAIKYCESSSSLSKAKFFQSDLFEIFGKKSKLPKKFDAIIFNPPYLPATKEPDKIKAYTTGGKHGYELLSRFLSQINEYLNDEGFVLIVFSSLTKKSKVDEAIARFGLESELLETQGLFFEQLFCYKITKSTVLKHLNSLKIKNPVLFAKGRRGLIYSAEYKGKHSIVKVANPEAVRVVSTIECEATWLHKLNLLGIGPKLYYHDSLIVVMELLEGDFILDYLEKNKKNRDKIKSLIMNVLDQMIILDRNNLEKLEMTRPIRHIIVVGDKPILIDFERTRKTQRPGNVTQFLQFISSSQVNSYLNLNKRAIIDLSKKYMKDRDIKPIRDYPTS